MKSEDELAQMFLFRKERFIDRDMRNRDLQYAMLGQWHRAYPSHFRNPSDRPMIHNALAVAAYDLAEMLAALPTFSVPVESESDLAQKRADKKARVLTQGYFRDWRWELKMLQTSLWYLTYGYVPVCLWPYARGRGRYAKPGPYADPVDPMGYLPGPVLGFGEQPVDGFVWWTRPAADFARVFPEAKSKLVRYHPLTGMSEPMSEGEEVTLARYHGRDEITLLLPDQGVILNRISLPADLEHPTLVQAMRPSVKLEEPQSPFEQLVGVLLAQARLAALVLRYAERQVHAPIEVDEETEWNEGPDALIRRARGAAPAQKVGLNMPADVWRELDIYERQIRLGSRRPASRDGESPVSYATGKGIDALASGLDSQLKANQTIFGEFLQDLAAAAMCLDEALYPNEERPIGGLKETYVASRDIAGRYTVEANYGLLMGINPSYATVMLSQLIAAGLLSRKTAMTQLPVIASLSKEYERLREEKGEDTLLAFLQQAALQGDQSAMEGLSQMAPDSPIVKIVAAMQAKAAEQAQQEQAAAGAEQGALPAPGAGPAPAGSPAPAAQVEQGAQALQQGSHDIRSLGTLLGPLAAQLGNQVA